MSLFALSSEAVTTLYHVSIGLGCSLDLVSTSISLSALIYTSGVT